jgi:hypothetical protein
VGGCRLNLTSRLLRNPSVGDDQFFVTADFASLALASLNAINTSANVMTNPHQYIHFRAGSGWDKK